MPMSLAEFDVRIGPTGRGTIVVNGEDVSDRCAAFQVTSEPGSPTRLVIQSYGEGRIQGEGVVEVQVAGVTDQRETVAEFLSNLDPAVLEQDVLERCGGLGGNLTTGQAFLEVLKGYVRGDDDGA